jgi:hypothetical protein
VFETLATAARACAVSNLVAAGLGLGAARPATGSFAGGGSAAGLVGAASAISGSVAVSLGDDAVPLLSGPTTGPTVEATAFTDGSPTSGLALDAVAGGRGDEGDESAILFRSSS